MSDAPQTGQDETKNESEQSPASDNTLTGILLLIPLGIGATILYWGLSSFGGPPSGCGWIGCMFDLRLSVPWAVAAIAAGGLLTYACLRQLLRL